MVNPIILILYIVCVSIRGVMWTLMRISMTLLKIVVLVVYMAPGGYCLA